MFIYSESLAIVELLTTIKIKLYMIMAINLYTDFRLSIKILKELSFLIHFFCDKINVRL